MSERQSEFCTVVDDTKAGEVYFLASKTYFTNGIYRANHHIHRRTTRNTDLVSLSLK